VRNSTHGHVKVPGQSTSGDTRDFRNGAGTGQDVPSILANGPEYNYRGFNGLAFDIGQAKNPGPHGFTLEVANVTHLANHAHIIRQREFDAMLITEHSAGAGDNFSIKDILGDCKLHLSQVDAEMAGNVGGTGVILRGKNHVNRPKARTAQLKELLDKGRIGKYTFEVTKGQFILCYIIYGYPRAENDGWQAARTCDLMATVFSDAEKQDPGPILIMGDINAPINRIPSLQAALQQGLWRDLGASASHNGGGEAQGTCRATTPGAMLTRRDYVFVNDRAFNMIESFDVDHDALLPVHSVLRVMFKGERPVVTCG
jgi:hypothetical protein